MYLWRSSYPTTILRNFKWHWTKNASLKPQKRGSKSFISWEFASASCFCIKSVWFEVEHIFTSFVFCSRSHVSKRFCLQSTQAFCCEFVCIAAQKMSNSKYYDNRQCLVNKKDKMFFNKKKKKKEVNIHIIQSQTFRDVYFIYKTACGWIMGDFT